MLRRRFLALIALSLCACKVKLPRIWPDGPHKMFAHGITYTVPWEGCHFNTDERPLNYLGESVNVSEREGRLIVNERDCGPIGPGDEVDLMTKGKVLVNGHER